VGKDFKSAIMDMFKDLKVRCHNNVSLNTVYPGRNINYLKDPNGNSVVKKYNQPKI
jgi:hypothetical protein